MSRWSSMLMLSLLLLIAWSGPALARSQTSVSPALKGVNAVMVVISGISPQAEKDGLRRSDLQHDVEQRLAQAGIKVLTPGERAQAPGQPQLIVRFVDQKRTDMEIYAISIAVHLVQSVRLARDNKVVVPAETWGMSGVISVGAQELVSVRSLLQEYVDMFIQATHAANGVKPKNQERP